MPRTSTNPAILLTAAAEGSEHRTQASATTTAAWAADNYTWTSWVEKGSEKYTIDSSQITVRPDPRTAAAGYDGRSDARKALDDARLALTTYNPLQRSYKIADREKVFNSAADIIKFITYLEQQVANEERLAGRAEKPSRRIYSRI